MEAQEWDLRADIFIGSCHKRKKNIHVRIKASVRKLRKEIA